MRFMKMLLNGKILKFLLNSCLVVLVFASKVQSQDTKGTKEETGFVLDKIICKIDNYIVLKSELEAAYQLILK